VLGTGLFGLIASATWTPWNLPGQAGITSLWRKKSDETEKTYTMLLIADLAAAEVWYTKLSVVDRITTDEDTGPMGVLRPERLGLSTDKETAGKGVVLLIVDDVVWISAWPSDKTRKVNNGFKEIYIKFMMLMIPAVYHGNKKLDGFKPDARERWKRCAGSTSRWARRSRSKRSTVCCRSAGRHAARSRH